jgi:hypothetical protein
LFRIAATTASSSRGCKLHVEYVIKPPTLKNRRKNEERTERKGKEQRQGRINRSKGRGAGQKKANKG